MATVFEKKDLLDRSLDRIVAILIEEYDPEKIILRRYRVDSSNYNMQYLGMKDGPRSHAPAWKRIPT